MNTDYTLNLSGRIDLLSCFLFLSNRLSNDPIVAVYIVSLEIFDKSQMIFSYVSGAPTEIKTISSSVNPI